MYVVYLVQCRDGSYYCGYTVDLDKRISKHNDGMYGAKYTRSRRPVSLVYSETFRTKNEALKREHAIKKMNHDEKKKLAVALSDKVRF